MRDETRNRLPQRQMAEEVAAVCLLGGVVVLASLAWLALAIGDQLSHLAAPAGNPASALVDVVLGRVRWTAAATVAFVGELVGVGAVVGGVWWVVQHHSARRLEVDRRAQRLPRSARSRARYVDPTQAPVPGPGPGLVVGVDVVDGAAFRQSWEDVAVMVAGSRTGKTTSQVAPAIRSAPGAVYACSNKRDIVDLTNQARTERRSASGTAGRLWLFDPQQIATDEPAAFWWNPLDMARDVAGARTLAGLFAAASRPPGAQRDAYFDSEGEELVALLLLAAALDDKALPTVYRWLTQGWDRGITDVLADHGHRLAAEGLQDVAQMPDKQKAGVVGTARKNVAFLADPALAPWITDVPAGRPRFRAQEFASTPDTLYSLSKEGPGSAGALTGALTAAVVLAAEHLAASEPDGRLEVPLVCVLDEVANGSR
jgi:hypothetical protein